MSLGTSALKLRDHYTYPSPKPLLMLTSLLGKILALGRGRWAVSQKLIMIQS